MSRLDLLRRPGARKALLALWIPVILAVAGFLGVLSSSLIPLSPASDLVALGRQVKEARAGSPSAAAARELDQAAATLEAARRAIEHQGERPWRLRSYERARTLLWKTELFLERAQTSAPRSAPEPVVPAG